MAIALGQRAYADAKAKPDVQADAARGWRAIALLLGLAASYEPLVLVAAVAALAPWADGIVRLRRMDRAQVRDALPAFLLGLAPLSLAAALLRRAPEMAIATSKPLASPFGESAGATLALGPFAMAEIGTMIVVTAVAGALLCSLQPAARRCLASLLGVVASGILALALHAPSGPWHTAAPLLAATCAVHMLAALALAAAVAAIGTARVPFAQASAALAVVLELVLPVRATDETLARREGRAFNASTVWNEVAWGALPTAAVLLVAEPVTMRRIAAASASAANM
jgi:hypothetical protein